MVTVGMNYQIISGKQQEFESVFDKVLTVMGKLDGHTHTRLFRDVTDETQYMILSEWRDRGSFEAFTASPQFKNVTDWGKSKILATQPRHEVYETGTSATTQTTGGGCPAHA